MAYVIWAGPVSPTPSYPICLGVERPSARDAFETVKRLRKRFPRYQFIVRGRRLTDRLLSGAIVVHH